MDPTRVKAKGRDRGEGTVSTFSAYETNALKTNLYCQNAQKLSCSNAEIKCFFPWLKFFPGKDPRTSRFKGMEERGEFQNFLPTKSTNYEQI